MRACQIITALGLLALMLLAGASSIRAGGFEIVQQSATAGGTASAGTARSADPSAAWYNPAALADGQGFRAGLGGALAFPSFEAKAADGSWRGSTRSSMSTPAHLYLSYASSDWALGLSANVPFASGINWPSDWAARFETISSRPMFLRLAPFFAYRIGPIRLAAGPHVDLGKIETRRALNFIDSEGSVKLILSGVSAGGHGAVFWQVNDWIDVGFVYKSRTKLSLSGDADFTTPDSFAYRAQDQHAQTNMTLPDRIAFGGAARWNDFTFLLDLTVTIWSVNKKLVIDFENQETDDSVKISNWSPSVAVRGGVEWTPLQWVTGRMGTFFDQSPIADANLTPSSPDCNRTGISLGASANLYGFAWLDLFYEFTAFLERQSSSTNSPLASYKGQAHFVGLGFRFHLDQAQGS